MKAWATAILALCASVAAGGTRRGVRIYPRVSWAPSIILATLDLGEVTERNYCPRIRWDWGDGCISVQESDCPPWDEVARPQTVYTRRHMFRFGGKYPVVVRIYKGERQLGLYEALAIVRHGLDDPTLEPEEPDEW